MHLKEKGFSIIELIIASAIFVLFISSSGMLLFSGEDVGRVNLTLYKANLYAQEGLEATRVIRDGNWLALTQGDHGLKQSGSTWIFDGTSDVLENKYRRTITIASINENKKEARSLVRWFNAFGQEKQVEFKTYFTNWQRIREEESGGIIDLGDSANDIYVSGNYTYLAVNDQHTSLMIVNTTNPSNPSIVSTKDLNGPGEDVFVVGNYAYVVLSTNKMIILNISNPSNPSQVSSVNLSAKPSSIFVFNGYAYIGQLKLNEGLVMYNVSNPAAPQYYRSYNKGLYIYDVKVVNGWIYLAINSGRGFDVSDEGNYAYAYVAVDIASGGFETYHLHESSIDRLSVVNVGSGCNNAYYDNRKVYLACKNTESGLVRLNTSSINHPAFIDNFDIEGEGNGVFYKNSYTYMAVENIDGGLAIVQTP
jgi:hypothetical protein